MPTIDALDQAREKLAGWCQRLHALADKPRGITAAHDASVELAKTGIAA